MKGQWIMIALFGAMAAAQAADVYRWVDANGVVHYTDSPPQGAAKAEVVHIPGAAAPPPAAAAPSQGEDTNAKADDSEEVGEKKLPGKLASSVQSPEKRCADARANLEVLQGSGPVGVDMGNGKPKPLDNKARQQRVENAQTIIATYCK